MEIQLQMAQLRGKGKDCKSISLTEGGGNAIIVRNGIEVSLELLDGCVREVWLYLDGTVEVSWGGGED